MGDAQSVFALVLLPRLGNPWAAAMDARLGGGLDGHSGARDWTIVIVLGRRSTPLPLDGFHGEVRRVVRSASIATTVTTAKSVVKRVR